MKSQMIVKSNIFDKINNYMSNDMKKYKLLSDETVKYFALLTVNCGESNIKIVERLSGVRHSSGECQPKFYK